MTATDEQVFVNGKTFTARNEEEFVSAFKVTDGKFSWVGDVSEVDKTGARTNRQSSLPPPGS